MPGVTVMSGVRSHLARVAWAAMRPILGRHDASTGLEIEVRRRADAVRFHLGRGRRARDLGRYARGVTEARRALAENPQEPWALSLLGQCLMLQPRSDLLSARRALERAQALEPMNGYFVRLLLDVLDAQGDAAGRADMLAWAWWNGAPVERWLPEGPPLTRSSVVAVSDAEHEAQTPTPGPSRAEPEQRSAPVVARQLVSA